MRSGLISMMLCVVHVYRSVLVSPSISPADVVRPLNGLSMLSISIAYLIAHTYRINTIALLFYSMANDMFDMLTSHFHESLFAEISLQSYKLIINPFTCYISFNQSFSWIVKLCR